MYWNTGSQFITNTTTTTTGEKHPGDTTHEIGNCGRNLPEMSQGAKANGNSWTTQLPLVTLCKTLSSTGSVKSKSCCQTHELHNHLNYTK